MDLTPAEADGQERADFIFLNQRDQKMHARLFVFGLLVNCPFKNNMSADCPLCKFRHLSLEKKMLYAEGISDHAVEKILRFHTACLERRLLSRGGTAGYLTRHV